MRPVEMDISTGVTIYHGITTVAVVRKFNAIFATSPLLRSHDNTTHCLQTKTRQNFICLNGGSKYRNAFIRYYVCGVQMCRVLTSSHKLKSNG